ncbi:hypothetical protein R0381_002533 [Jeongeupia wiesaeckerbachi]|uniref:Lar family restriction alleviation protein n=1 Tax=Jeongeupia wiesaeckerbachi TaxID=3051218 RepID=UPI003D80313D
MTDPKPPVQPQSCPKCGAPPDVRKAGANRVWVQCAKFGANGNCNVICSPQPNRKDAIAAWNRMK